jgi:hypothetical protein
VPQRAQGENALNGGELAAGADALTTLCEQHGQPAAADVLARWARARPR